MVSPEWMSRAQDYFYDNWNTAPLGYTVALMREGRLLGASSFGFAKSPADGGVRLTADAQWDYLSDSKWITTLAAAAVAQDNNIDVTTTEILPVVASALGITIPNTNDPNDFWHITVYHAMTHTSNLQDGGCLGPNASTWGMPPGPGLQLAGGSGNFNYSGYNSCLLRLWIEEVSGMPFERYVDTRIFRPAGIHNVDCTKDWEKVEVLQYVDPTDTNPGASEPNAYCGHHGFKGTPLQMLQILQAVRTPGLILTQPWLDDMRTGSMGGGNASTMGGDEWTFFQSAFDADGIGGVDAYGFSMTGGRVGMRTHIAQFPEDPSNPTDAFEVSSYEGGIDAVFFTNAGPAFGPNVQWQSIQEDPNP